MNYAILLLKLLTVCLGVGVAARLAYPRFLTLGWVGTVLLGTCGSLPASLLLYLIGWGFHPWNFLALLMGTVFSTALLFTRKFDAPEPVREPSPPYWTFFYL